jgi:hypothetical protein
MGAMAGFRFVAISHSVGRGRRNLAIDVEHVQELMNTVPGGHGAFDAHGALLAHHPAYAAARQHLDDANAYAHALEGHYSTTVGYGNTLVTRMREHDLYQWNVPR